MSSLRKNTIFLLSASAAQKIISFIYFVFLSRYLGPNELGKYFFAISFASLFSALADFGLTPVLIRKIAQTEEKEEATNFLRNTFSLKIFFSILAYLTTVACAIFLGYSQEIIYFILLSGLIMWLDSFHLLFYGVFRGLQKLIYEASGIFFGELLILTLGCAGIFFKKNLMFFFMVLLAGSLFNFLWAAIFLKKNNWLFWPNFQKKSILYILSLSSIFFLSNVFYKIYSSIDVVILKHFLTTNFLGWYSIVSKINTAFQFIPIAISASVYPAFSQLFSQNQIQLKKTFFRALNFAYLLAVPITLGIFALSKEIILTFYGPNFYPAIQALKIAIFALIFVFPYFPVGALLNGTHRQNLNVFGIFLTALLNLCLNIFLIRKMNILGASLTSVISSAFLYFFALVVSGYSRQLFYEDFKEIIKIFLAGTIMTIFVFLSKLIVPWYLTILVGALIYALAIFAFKIITKQDIFDFLNIFKKIEL